MYGGLNRLKGEYLYGYTLAGDGSCITFHCKSADFVFDAVGDCCSETFIDSVEGPSTGLIDSVESGGECECQEDKYGETKYYRSHLCIQGKGFLDIDYRNESNGYYGGSLELRNIIPHENNSHCTEGLSSGSPERKNNDGCQTTG